MLRARAVWYAMGFIIAGLAVGVLLSHTVLRAGFTDPSEEEIPTRRAEIAAQLDRDVAALEAQGNVLKNAIRLIRPTVVHIEADKTDAAQKRLGRTRTVEESGSGIIVEIHGKRYVITNRHVIKGARLSRIKLRLWDGREITPQNVWTDPDTDVAVLQVAGPRLISCEVGNSDHVEIGDFVLAFGSPYGLSHSVTYGIISAKGRRDLQLGDSDVRFQDFIQTDAAINPGNSGGPLLDLRGRVIGINTCIASTSGSNEGVGFAIPINMVMAVAKQLIERGRVVRAFLGVNLDSKFDAASSHKLGLPRPIGARVISMTADSPARGSDLRIGDVILEFDGISVENDGHLINIISLTDVNKDVPVVVWREGRTAKFKVRVGDRSKFEKK